MTECVACGWSERILGKGQGTRSGEEVTMTKKESQPARESQVEQRVSADRRVAQRRRPDEALTRELQEILTGDPELDASEIEVAVEGGAVTLRGTVDSGDAKLLAEELVESVTGVREVHNQLKVAR